jgi:hypothetical protein
MERPLRSSETLEIDTDLAGFALPYMAVAVPEEGVDTRRLEGWCRNGDVRLELSRLKLSGCDKWYIYVEIDGKIVTSPFMVEVATSSLASGGQGSSSSGGGSRPGRGRVLASISSSDRSESPSKPPEPIIDVLVTPAAGRASTRKGKITIYPTAYPTAVNSQPPGETFVGREAWDDGSVVATFVRESDRCGTLRIQYLPSGNEYEFPIYLQDDNIGRPALCTIQEPIPMVQRYEGETRFLSTDRESAELVRIPGTKSHQEYFVLTFGYAYPAGNGPQARIGGVTGTPRIKLYRAEQ